MPKTVKNEWVIISKTLNRAIFVRLKKSFEMDRQSTYSFFKKFFDFNSKISIRVIHIVSYLTIFARGVRFYMLIAYFLLISF